MRNWETVGYCVAELLKRMECSRMGASRGLTPARVHLRLDNAIAGSLRPAAVVSRRMPTIISRSPHQETISSLRATSGVVDSEGVVGAEDMPLPDGHMGWPIIGETLALTKDTNYNAKKTKKFGPVYRTKVLGSNAVVVNGIDRINKIMNAEPPLVGVSQSKVGTKLLGHDVITSMDGPRHISLRNILKAAFLPSALESYMPLVTATAREKLQQWSSAEGPVLFEKEIQDFTFKVSMNCIVGLPTEDVTTEELLKLLTDWFGGFFSIFGINLPFTGFGRAIKARNKLVKIVRKGARKYRAEKGETQEKTALAVLSKAVDEDGSILSEEELEQNILLLMFAGYDTTAVTAMILMKALSKHPEVIAKAAAEQKDLISKFGEDISLVATESMPYLTAVIKESMRLEATARIVVRKALETFEIDGYRVPKDWLVVLELQGSMREYEERWPGDLSFDPDRFLTGNGGKMGGQIPWGVGFHSCLGKTLAMLELRVMFAYMIRGYDFRLESYPETRVGIPTSDGFPITFFKREG